MVSDITKLVTQLSQSFENKILVTMMNHVYELLFFLSVCNRSYALTSVIVITLRIFTHLRWIWSEEYTQYTLKMQRSRDIK